MTGVWLNTNPNPKLIRRVTFDGATTLRVSGGAIGPHDWGHAPVSFFVEGENSAYPTAFTAAFRGAGFSSHLQAYVVKGVLVIVSMIRLPEEPAGPGFFIKEFFYRESA